MNDKITPFIINMNKKHLLLTYLSHLNKAITEMNRAETIVTLGSKIRLEHGDDFSDIEEARIKIEKLAKQVREEIKKLEELEVMD